MEVAGNAKGKKRSGMLSLACLKATVVNVQLRAQGLRTHLIDGALCVCLGSHFQIEEVTELKIFSFVTDATKLILSQISR